MSEEMSPLAQAVEERAKNRPVELFDLEGFFHLGGKPVTQVAIRPLLKWEQDSALQSAEDYLRESIRHENVRNRPEVFSDAELACVTWHAARKHDDPRYPAFPSPTWMCKNMSTEQLSVLANLLNAVRAKHAPSPPMFDGGALDNLVKACAELGETDLPDKVLAGYPREMLVHVFVLLCSRVTRLQAELEAAGRRAAGELPEGIEIQDGPVEP